MIRMRVVGPPVVEAGADEVKDDANKLAIYLGWVGSLDVNRLWVTRKLQRSLWGRKGVRRKKASAEVGSCTPAAHALSWLNATQLQYIRRSKSSLNGKFHLLVFNT